MSSFVSYDRRAADKRAQQAAEFAASIDDGFDCVDIAYASVRYLFETFAFELATGAVLGIACFALLAFKGLI